MSLADRAYELIRKDILRCDLQPGQSIVQAVLADKYGVGMTPVREALQRLAHEGLVQPVPRAGYTVSHITLSSVRELFELRNILETAAVRMAVARASDEQLRQVSENASFTYVYTDKEDYDRFLARNQEFHCSIAVLGGNQRLVETLSETLDGLNRVFHLGLEVRDSAEEMRAEHVALAKALVERDEERASAIVSNQIARSIQRVMDALTSGVHSSLSADTGQGIHTVVLGEKTN